MTVAAPGGRVIDGDAPATELALRGAARDAAARLTRSSSRRRWPNRGWTSASTRASALSYEVRAGEYIQIIDVRGKQCSDFLAFHRAKLEAGSERGLDGVVTRTLMGNAYPQPGLHGKFYDLDMDPLVRGGAATPSGATTRSRSPARPSTTRTWATPATSTAPTTSTRPCREFQIAPRKGWEALNFFYNTAFDSSMQLISDEPWSRPGDYVMVRALEDLVCASSACPDDIDPSNGWEVTDVHVRVYPQNNRFSMAVARRVTADAEPVLTQADRVPRAHRGPDQVVRRVPRLLAAALLQQRGRDRRVLGVPSSSRPAWPS